MKKKGVKKRKREKEKEENKTGRVKRRCEGFVSVEAFGDLETCGGFSRGDLLEKPEDWSEFESDTQVGVRVVPDVIDVLVSPSSVVTEFFDGVPCCSDWDFVEPQSFSFSKKRAHSCTVTQEDVV